MSARVTGWIFGLLVAIGSGLVLSQSQATRDFRIHVGLVVLTVAGFVTEVVAWLVFDRSADRHTPPDGARLADGVIEVASIQGVETTINPETSEFCQFDHLTEFATSRDKLRTPFLENPPCLGRVVVVSVFVGKDGQRWSPDEIVQAHKSLQSAAVWLEKQAIRYVAKVNMSLAEVYFAIEDDVAESVEVAFVPEAGDFGPMEAGASTKALIAASRFAARLGFGDVAAWFAEVERRIEADVILWVFHYRQAGRSLAIPRTESELPGVGFAICYSQEDSFPNRLNGPGQLDPTSVIHELLHLCGASDKYGQPLSSFPVGTVGRREIMRLNRSRLVEMEIDSLTANEIGWPPRQMNVKA